MKKYLGVMGLIVFVGLVASENNERIENVRPRTCSRGRANHARKESVSPIRMNRSQNFSREGEQKESTQESRVMSQKPNDFLNVPYGTVTAALNRSSRSADEIIEDSNV